MLGRVISNYRVVEKIGEGGMGAVFKGVDLMLEREVAIKMLRPELASQPEVVERFRAEAVTLARLNHPNIATLYNFFHHDGQFFMVMEFVEGESLDDHLRNQGALACERAIPLFCLALEGIDYAHGCGVIHRDIKPANMMLTHAGSLKVMDFGIARVLGASRMTKHGHVVGTVEYMSPEQVLSQQADARSDIYSLGILLYEMLTGRVPFSSTSEFELMKAQVEMAPRPPREFAGHIPLAVEQVIMRSLAKRPAARFQTAGEFRATLLRSLNENVTGMQSRPALPYVAATTRLSDPYPPTVRLNNAAAATAPTAISPAPTSSDEQPTSIKPSPFIRPESRTAEAARKTPSPSLPEQSIIKPLDKQDEAALIASRSQAAQSKRSLFARPGWIGWAGAVFVLIAIVGIGIATMSRRQPTVAPDSSSVTESISSQANANEASSEQAASLPLTEQDATATQPGSESTTAPVEEGANGEAASSSIAVPEKSKPARSGRDKESTNYEAAEPVLGAVTVEKTVPNAPAAQSAEPPASSVAVTQPQTMTNQPATASASDGNKQEEKKKKGGFLKKLGSIFKGDDKKNEKKP